MNYYEHHIGDFDQATAHLTACEDGIYSRLIRRYYATEKPLPVEVSAVQRLVRARTKEEKQAVSAMLTEFFRLEADGWHQTRCDEDLARYIGKQEKARASAHARWGKPQCEGDAPENANAMRTHSEGNAPRARTSPQTPDTRHQETPAESSSTPALAVVPAKPNTTPVTSTKGSRLSLNTLPLEWAEFCRQERDDLNPEAVFAKFRDWWIAKAGKDGVKLDWFATWRNWVRNESGKKANGGLQDGAAEYLRQTEKEISGERIR